LVRVRVRVRVRVTKVRKWTTPPLKPASVLQLDVIKILHWLVIAFMQCGAKTEKTEKSRTSTLEK